MTRYWVSRLGRKGKYIDNGLKGGFIAIGWPQMGNLDWVRTGESDYHKIRDKLKKVVAKSWGGKADPWKVANESTMLMSFIRDMKIGDIVMVPDPRTRDVHMGRITGSYEYKDDWGDGCEYVRRRSVDWITSISRDDMSPKLRFSIGAGQTVFNLDKHSEEIEVLMAGEEYTVPKPEFDVEGKELVDYMIEKMMEMDADEFEEFVSSVLGTLGIQSSTTQKTGDKGVDVIGILDAEGLAGVRLHVQVKRVSKPVGIKTVLNLRGTLRPDDQGTIVTTGEFTNQAQDEAEDSEKKPIRLISGRDFVELILRVYDSLEEKYRRMFGLKKVEVSPLDQYFVPGKGQDV